MAELLKNGELLGFANLLNDYLLCRLRGNAAEIVLRLQREDYFVAKLCVSLNARRIIDEHVLLGVVAWELALGNHFLMVVMRVVSYLCLLLFRVREAHRALVNNRLYLLKGNGARVHVELSADNLSALSVLLLIGSSHRVFDGVYHGFLADAALLEFSEHCVDGFEV